MSERIALVINELSGELATLEEKIQMLRTTIENLRKLDGPAAVSLPTVSPSSQSFAGMSVERAALAYIRTYGRPVNTRTIANALERGGIVSSNHYRAVYNSLSKSDAAVIDPNTKLWSLKA